MQKHQSKKKNKTKQNYKKSKKIKKKEANKLTFFLYIFFLTIEAFFEICLQFV